jgi:hypothetical protein
VAYERLDHGRAGGAGPARVLDLAMVEAPVRPTRPGPSAAQRRSLAMAASMPSSSTVSPTVNASMASPSR